MNKDIIHVSTSYKIDQDPVPIQFNFNQKDRLMLAIGIVGLNLSDTHIKYVDVKLRQNFYSLINNIINSTLIPLTPCTT